MATARANPLASLLKRLIVFLLAALVSEVIWLALGRVLFTHNNSEEGLNYNTEQAQMIQLPSSESFSEAVNRSLFNWNRRPKAAEQQLVSENSLSSLWQLTGVVNTGQAVYAIFSEINGERRLKLETGMNLESWQVQAITTELVRLTKDEEEQLFYLKEISSEIIKSSNGTIKNSIQERTRNSKKFKNSPQVTGGKQN